MQMENVIKQEINIDELIQEDIVIVDFEANQIDKIDYLLQFGCIKKTKDKKEIKISGNVYQEKPLSRHVSNYINKPPYFFKNKKFMLEKEAYIKLLEFTKGCKVITYGSYDQRLIDSVANRYKLETIPLIDISRIFENKTKNAPSLSKLAYLFGIDETKYQRHDSFDDALLLYDVFMKYCSIKDKIDLQQTLSLLNIELLRPKVKTKQKVQSNTQINENHFYVVDLYFKNSFLVDNQEDPIRFNTKYYNYIISNKGIIISKQHKEKSHLTKSERNEFRHQNINNLKEILKKYKNNIVLVTNYNPIEQMQPEELKTIYGTESPNIYKVA